MASIWLHYGGKEGRSGTYYHTHKHISTLKEVENADINTIKQLGYRKCPDCNKIEGDIVGHEIVNEIMLSDLYFDLVSEMRSHGFIIRVCRKIEGQAALRVIWTNEEEK